MVHPVLEAGEQRLIHSRNVVIKGLPFQVYLTNRRLILQASPDRSQGNRNLPLDCVAGVAPATNGAGEPVLVLCAKSSAGEYRRLVLTFTAIPSLPHRTEERDAWYRQFSGVPGTIAGRSSGSPGSPIYPDMSGSGILRCTACGRSVPPGSRYCDRCGVRILPQRSPLAGDQRYTACLGNTIQVPEPAGYPRTGCSPTRKRIQTVKTGSGSWHHSGNLRTPPSRLHRFVYPALTGAMVACIGAGVFMLVSPVGFARFAGTILQGVLFLR